MPCADHPGGRRGRDCHPARCRLSANEEFALFSGIQAAWGQAVEVVTGSHSAAEAVSCAAMAQNLAYAALRGSDFHSPDESHTDLGTLPPARPPPARLGRLSERIQPAHWTFVPWPSIFEFTWKNFNRACSNRLLCPLQKGGVVAVPTDSSYCHGCATWTTRTLQTCCAASARWDDKHHLTLLCRDLSDCRAIARVADNHGTACSSCA